MRIKIPINLPAIDILAKENIKIGLENEGNFTLPKCLNIILLNLMPKKEETETDFIRVLSNCDINDIELNIDFLKMESHTSKNTSKEHLDKFYKTYQQIAQNKYDGMIVTGAPVELFPFENVTYWEELKTIFDWSKCNVRSTIYICWGAQAALHHFYGIGKKELGEKMFGIFSHKKMNENEPLLEGFDETFMIPHSRHTESIDSEISRTKGLEIIAESAIAGKSILKSNAGREFYISGHLEYPKETLQNEYLRDKAKGLPIKSPMNYYKGEGLEKEINFCWRDCACLLFQNWINYYCLKK